MHLEDLHGLFASEDARGAEGGGGVAVALRPAEELDVPLVLPERDDGATVVGRGGEEDAAEAPLRAEHAERALLGEALVLVGAGRIDAGAPDADDHRSDTSVRSSPSSRPVPASQPSSCLAREVSSAM